MTILFHQDWDYYPDAIVDVKTRNQSFVQLATKYREMGIKNHAFLLALHNPELQGVNPHDPNLTPEQVAMIMVEAKTNAWYFMRECLMVPPRTGTDYTQFLANRGNICLWWSFFNHITTILIQIRQTGKSLSCDGLAVYLMNVRCNNTQINLLTKDDNLRANNIKRLKDIEDGLPYFMKQRTRADANNTENLTVKVLGNSYMGHVPQSSPKNALKVGRGLTSPIFFIDEAPFQPNIELSLPAALTAGSAARDAARAKKEPFGTIITTTAGKKDDRDGKFIYDMLCDSALWSEKFFDASEEKELETLVRRNSPKGRLRINATFNHIQLGKNDEWLKVAIEGAEKITPEEADRDFFNIWTSGSQSSPLPIPILERIRKSVRAPLHDTTSRIGGYITRWYVPEAEREHIMRTGKFVMSFDTSDAQGGDDISMFMVDVKNGETVATGKFNETNLITFGEFIAEWIINYENITVIIERRSSGVAIIDLLLRILPSRGIDPYKRLFNRVVNDSDELRKRFDEVACTTVSRRDPDNYVINKKTFGFATSASGVTSRSELYSVTLQGGAKKIGDRVRDLMTVNQITSLVTINGRVDHPPGGHDDMVIAWLLCYWLLTQGKNLSFYGINHRDILRDVVVEEKLISAEGYYQQREQMGIRQEMEEIYEKLKVEKDEYISQYLEHRLRFLNSKLILEENEIYSIDDLINTIKESKKRSKVFGNGNASGAPQRSYNANYRDPHTGGGWQGGNSNGGFSDSSPGNGWNSGWTGIY